MKTRKILVVLALVCSHLVGFGQQIGSGYAPEQIPSFNIDLLSGFYQGLNAAGIPDGSHGGWNHLLNLRHSNYGNNHQLQIASSYAENDRMFFRKFARGLGAAEPIWHEIATRGVNTFNGNQVINGQITSSFASNEGGSIKLTNNLKNGIGASEWVLYNMTAGYGNSLQFWNYGLPSAGPKFTILDEGNVGIGTSTPSAKLHINNGNNSYGAILANADENPFALYTKTLATQPVGVESFRLGLKYGNNENNGFISFHRGQSEEGGFLSFATNGTEKMRINIDGNVGIGTATPNSKLSIIGNGTGVSITPGGSPYYGCIAFNREAGTGQIFDSNAQAFQINNGGNDKNLHFQIYNGNGTQITDNALVIKGTNGNVGIGTANPDQALTVNGTIHSKEVIVDTNITPDYVFQKYYTGSSSLNANYVMPTLAEIEDFTKKNNHLPNVPSAAEAMKNGVSLGEMSNILLQKVEELTLYIIEQNKKIEVLEAKVNNK